MVNKVEKITSGSSEVSVEGQIDQKTREEILAFLESKKEKAESFVAVISAEELDALKGSINSDPSSLPEFLEKQEKETITSTEIMSWSKLEQNLGWKEELKLYLDALDSATYDYLFNDKEALFKTVKLSEDEKRNFSTWVLFFILKYINEKIKTGNLKWDISKIAVWLLGWEDSEQGILEKLPEIGEQGWSIVDSVSKWYELFEEINFSDLWKTFDSFFGSDKLKVLKEALKELKIETKWETNGIFINPLESHDFMAFVFNTQNITKEQILEYVKSKKDTNTEFNETEKTKLQNIWDELTTLVGPNLWKVLSKGLAVKKIYEKWKDSVKDVILWNKTILSILWFLESIPFIWSIVSSFLSFLGISNLKDIISGESFEKTKKAMEISIVKPWSFFEWKKIPKDFMKNSSWKDDLVFSQWIKSIIWDKKDEKLWEAIESLFKKGWDLINFYNDVKDGLWIWDLINADEINYKELSKTIKHYNSFLSQQKTNPKLTATEYQTKIIKERKAEEQENAQDEALFVKSTLPIIESTSTTEHQTTQTEQIQAPNVKKEETPPAIQVAPKEVPLVTEAEWFSIWNTSIKLIFEEAWIKYLAKLKESWEIIVQWWWEAVKFSWWEEIFTYFKKFKNVLNEIAKASHFWKDIPFYNPELNWYKVYEVLVNWLHNEQIWPKTINRDWLKDTIKKYLISKDWIKKSPVELETEEGKTTPLTFVKAVWRRIEKTA